MSSQSNAYGARAKEISNHCFENETKNISDYVSVDTRAIFSFLI